MSTSAQGRRWTLAIVVILAVFALFEWNNTVETLQNGILVGALSRNATTNNKNKVTNTTLIQDNTTENGNDNIEKMVGSENTVKKDDLVDIQSMQRLAQQARDKLIRQLQQDYGSENFATIFQYNSTSHNKFRSAIVPIGEKSTKRFQRKLEIKLLHVMERASQQQQQQVPPYYETMIWATGGHSAAAGHGNLHNQSYTAVMERSASRIFASVGIKLVGRNFAMGGTASAPEVALCSEAIFGTDIDVLSWDYGMIDGKWKGGEAMYTSRAGLNPSRPILVNMNAPQKKGRFPQFIQMQQHVQARGQAAFYLDPSELERVKSSIPDTFGKSQAEIVNMPSHVQYLKCEGNIEKGDPGCNAHKFSHRDGPCGNRKGMATWHPGWKMHALYGNFMALFLTDMLLEAIDNLAASTTTATTTDRQELLARLNEEQEHDYEQFLTSPSPEPFELEQVPVDEDLMTANNVSVFFRSPSICHVATLPSMTRYLGILTESINETGVQDYYKGIHIGQTNALTSLEGSSSTDREMPLVWDNAEREANSCPLELRQDHKDYFYVSDRMSSAILTVPNAAELQAYGRDSQELLGIVVICLVRCPWHRCPNGAIRDEEIRNGDVQLEINGQLVTNATKFGGECLVLQGKGNGHRFEANDAGQFVLRAKILREKSLFRISSLTVL